MHNPGDSVLITDIKEQPMSRSDPGSTLRCITTNINTQCCRSRDNPENKRVGEWYFPDGRTVPSGRNVNPATDAFASYGYKNETRLAGIVGMTNRTIGLYRCAVPDAKGVIINAIVNLSLIPAGKK